MRGSRWFKTESVLCVLVTLARYDNNSLWLCETLVPFISSPPKVFNTWCRANGRLREMRTVGYNITTSKSVFGMPPEIPLVSLRLQGKSYLSCRRTLKYHLFWALRVRPLLFEQDTPNLRPAVGSGQVPSDS